MHSREFVLVILGQLSPELAVLKPDAKQVSRRGERRGIAVSSVFLLLEVVHPFDAADLEDDGEALLFCDSLEAR